MDNWLRLYNKDARALENEELKCELSAQRFLMRGIERLIGNAKIKIREMEDNYSESLKKENIQNCHLKRKENAIHSRNENLRFLELVFSTSKAYIDLLEDEYAYRVRLKRIGKRAIREKKQKEIFHEVNRARKVNRSEPIEKVYNRDALNTIANDRGYKMNETFLNDVAKMWNVGIPTAKKILDSGKFTWGQVLLLGHMLEMTPREFSEAFMRGYFEEVSEGKFRAWGDEKELVYNPPPQHEYVPPETVIIVDESGEQIAEGEYFEVNWDK